MTAGLVMLIVAPLLGLTAAFLAGAAGRPSLAGRIVVMVSALIAAVGVASIIGHSSGMPTAMLGGGTWLHVSGPVPLQSIVRLRLDPLAVVLITAAALLSAVVASGAVRSRGRRLAWPFFPSMMALLAVFTAYCLLADFLQLFACWTLVGLIAYLLVNCQIDDPQAAVAARKMFVTGLSTDVLLVFGLLLIWASFQSFDSATVFSQDALAQLIDRNPAMIGLIAACLLTGVVGRCAQFPLSHWPFDVAGLSAWLNAILSVLVLPSGAVLLLRSEPLFAEAADVRTLASALGGLTALLAAGSALTQTDLRRVTAYLVVSQFGWVLLAAGCPAPWGIAAGAFQLLGTMLGGAMMFVAAAPLNDQTDLAAADGSRSLPPIVRWAILIGGLNLAGLMPLTGFWTQLDVLHAVWRTAETPSLPVALPQDVPAIEDGESVPVEPLYRLEPPVLYRVLFGSALVTQFLAALAAMRAFFLTQRQQGRPPDDRLLLPGPVPRGELLILISLAIAFGTACGPLTGLLAGYLNRSEFDWDGFIAGSSVILVLLGVVFAWMLYATPSTAPARIARSLGALTRLSRNRFYLDEVYLLAVNLPIRALAQLGRFFDWFVIESMAVSLTERLPLLLVRVVQPLQNGIVQFYALATVMALSVLLLVLFLILD